MSCNHPTGGKRAVPLDHVRWYRHRLTGRLRRLAGRIALGLLDRFGEVDGLDEAQRAWLLEDVGEDLAALIDDAENRGVTEQAAREMLVIRGLVRWLEGGTAPGSEAIGYLERSVATIPRNPDDAELSYRTTYLAAIGELGGDEEAASRLWREPSGDPEQVRRLLDLQGRRIRGLMEERELSVGELARESRIDTVTLVSILYGLEEMRAVEWMRLSEAFDVSLDVLVVGSRRPPSGEEAAGRADDDTRTAEDRRGEGGGR
jgi:hypothetical protein